MGRGQKKLIGLRTVGWGKSSLNDPSSGPAFGTPAQDPESFRSKGIHLISSIRTLCRGAYILQRTSGLRARSQHHKDQITLTRSITVPLIGVNLMIIIYELLLG